MTLTLMVNGATVAATAGSIRWQSTIGERDRLDFRLDLLPGMPQDGGRVTLDQDATRLFTGSVEQYVLSGARDLLWQLAGQYNCVDMSQTLDRRRVTGRFDSTTGVTWTAGGIVRRLVDNFLAVEDITKGTIDDGPAVELVVFNYDTASDAVRELAEMTGYTWWVDTAGALHFRENILAGMAAPWGLTATSLNYRQIRVKVDRSQLRTVQYIRGGLGTGSLFTQNFKGRGRWNEVRLRFPIGNPWDDPPSLRIEKTNWNADGSKYITNSYPVIYEIDHDNNGSWVYKQGENWVRTTDGGNLPEDNKLFVTYKSAVPVLLAATDTAAIARRAYLDGGSGWYESLEIDESLESLDLARQKAAGFLRKYGKSLRTVEYDTWAPGLRAGQLQSLDIPALGLSGSDWLIQSVEGRDRGKGALTFHVTVVSGESVGGWVDFYRRLARKRFVAGTDETLYLLRTGWLGWDSEDGVSGWWVRTGYGAGTARLGIGKLGAMQLGQA